MTQCSTSSGHMASSSQCSLALLACCRSTLAYCSSRDYGFSCSCCRNFGVDAACGLMCFRIVLATLATACSGGTPSAQAAPRTRMYITRKYESNYQSGCCCFFVSVSTLKKLHQECMRLSCFILCGCTPRSSHLVLLHSTFGGIGRLL